MKKTASELKSECQRIGQVLSSRRKAMSWTQPEVAEKLGFESAGYICIVEKGKAKIPLDKVFEWAKAYDLNPLPFYALVLKLTYPDYLDAFDTFLGVLQEKEINNMPDFMEFAEEVEEREKIKEGDERIAIEGLYY